RAAPRRARPRRRHLPERSAHRKPQPGRRVINEPDPQLLTISPRSDERLSAPYAFAVLEPTFDGFRNYLRAGEKVSPETLLVERAFMLNLSAPEMTVLIGGMRALNANFRQAPHGVLTDRPETLTNDFFVNLLDMNTEWKASASSENVFDGRDRVTGEVKWTGTAVDLVFGSNSQLR